MSASIRAKPPANILLHFTQYSCEEPEISLRETLSPLKSLKTAKSEQFLPQRYQRLSEPRDFAGEAISIRFGPHFASREIGTPILGRPGLAARRAQKFGESRISRSALVTP
jgi:hypothetical protein